MFSDPFIISLPSVSHAPLSCLYVLRTCAHLLCLQSGLTQQPLRESVHTVEVSPADSIDLSGSGGFAGGSFEIEHSEAELQQLQQQRRVRPISGTEQARAQAARRGGAGSDDSSSVGGMSIEFSGSLAESGSINILGGAESRPGTSAAAVAGRQGGDGRGAGRGGAEVLRFGADTPSLSGSSIDITGDLSISGGGVDMGGRRPAGSLGLEGSGDLPYGSGAGRPPSRRLPPAPAQAHEEARTPSLSGER